MSEHIDHAAAARRVLEAGRESAAKAKTAAQAGSAVEADGHGKKAYGCWLQAQAEATLALVEQQRIANLIALGRYVELPAGWAKNRVLIYNPTNIPGDPIAAEIREALGLS